MWEVLLRTKFAIVEQSKWVAVDCRTAAMWAISGMEVRLA